MARYKFLEEAIRRLRQGDSLQQVLSVPMFRFLVLGTEWASGNGGLSTFNRKLCIALAELGHEVVLYLSHSSESQGGRGDAEGLEAARRGIDLIRTDSTWRDVIPTKIKKLRPDFVVGHDRHSGDDAQKLQHDYFPNARNILFIHTDPAIEMFKGADPVRRARVKQDREETQRRLMRRADVVAAVGPRLFNHCEDIVAGFKPAERPDLVEFVPGFAARDEEPRADKLPKGKTPKVLLIGRAEDAYLKGLDIFRLAVDKIALAGLRARPNVLGAPVEEISRLYHEEDFGKDGDVLGYSSDPERIEEHFRSSYFAVMPSREEGFGLVALEAFEANRPIVVSERSGFAEWLLREVESLAPDMRSAAADLIFAIPARQHGDEEREFASAIADSLAAKLRLLLLDYPSSVENVRRLREILSPLGWAFRARKFVDSLPAASRAAFVTNSRRST